MASAADVVPGLPTTLPEDFSEWDGEQSAEAPPANPSGVEGPRELNTVATPRAQVEAPRLEAHVSGPPKLELPVPAPPAVDQPQMASAPKPDVPRDVPYQQPPVYPDFEALRAGLKAAQAVLRNGSAPEPQTQATPLSTVDESFVPVRPSAAVLNEPRNAPPLLAPAPSADEEAFFHQLRAIGSALNTQPIKSTNKSASARATEEVFFTPVLTPKHLSIKPVPSTPVMPRVAPEERPKLAKPFQVAAPIGVADAVDIPMFRSDLDSSANGSSDRTKWIKMGVIGLVSLLLLIFLGMRLLSPGKPTLAKQSVTLQPVVETDADTPATNSSKPSPATPSGDSKRALAKPSPIANAQPGTKVDDSQPTEVDPQLMNDQLTAAPKIPQDIKNKVKVEEPPSPGFVTPNTVDVAEAGTIGGAFSDQSRPKVTYVPYPVVSVPAAVAQGLLVQRTQPVYPPDAWYSGLTGKVVLEITVSRTGWVESVHLVSGARMFQKSAMDAVRTWRFKPYMIDNVAREFRTTLEVTFDQHSEGHPLSFLHFGSHSKKTSASAQSPQSDAAGAQ